MEMCTKIDLKEP